MTAQPIDPPVADYAYNPFASDYFADPYPEFAALRAAGRVHEHPLGFWMVSHYDDVVALLKSSQSVDEHRMTNVTGIMAMEAEVFGADFEPRGGGLSMLDRDPPTHTRLRKLVSKAFTPRSIAALEPEIERLVDQSLDRLADLGVADLIEELAFPLPFAVISQMMGMPEIDHVRLRELSGTLVRSLEPVPDEDLLRQIMEADLELQALMRDVIKWKRKHLADDLLSRLIQAEEDGDVLNDDELVAQVILLYVAGHETTVNLIGNGVLALLRQPDSLTQLRSAPELAANAVEELLRFDSPVQLSRRITIEEYAVADRVIPPGQFVIAALAAANRDPGHWGPDADVVRLDRADARGHVSFGGGAHYCLGANLARLEGRVAISRLVTRFPDLALGGEVEWNGRINLRGTLSLPIAV